jgi:hypothetical protein
MSHHLDTPLAAKTGQLLLDDLFAFPGEGSTVLVMDVNSNVNGLHTEPGFHPEARYEFKVHVDGAAFETLTYRVSFSEADSAGRQALQLHVLTGDEARDDDAEGEFLLEARTGETASADGTRIWAGRVGDPFYIDLALLGIINGALADGTAPDLSAWRPSNAKNSFANTTVDSIVLEISHEHPQLRPGTRTGVWAATKLATDAGGWRQVNRAGHPMMWPIFWPDDTDFSQRWWRPAAPQMTRWATARSQRGGCSRTSCITRSGRMPPLASAPLMAGRRRTTRPRQCCPSSPMLRSRQG